MFGSQVTDQAEKLLDWYDDHARTMAWRVSPSDRKVGVLPNPYHVWLSEIMLQQTTVAAVQGYFLKFIGLWPRVEDLADAADEDVMAAWAGLGYYARARNLLKTARIVARDYAGVFPNSHDALLKLPGIGPYTAAAISAIAFDLPETVLDGNVERVMARLFNVAEPLPNSKERLRAHARSLTPNLRPGDYAQAVMDLGAGICVPRNPNCTLCPIDAHCQAKAAGTHKGLPNKLPKKPKPTRRGLAYVAFRADGALLLERREEKGLLGGMLGWPGTEWQEGAPKPNLPIAGHWHMLDETVRHTFTHFHLELNVMVASGVKSPPERGKFVPLADFRPEDLPTVMRKVWNLVRTT